MIHGQAVLAQTLTLNFNERPFGLLLLKEAHLMDEEEIILILDTLDSKYHRAALQQLSKCNKLTMKVLKSFITPTGFTLLNSTTIH